MSYLVKRCPICGKHMKPLFNLLYCVDDCEKNISPNQRWFSYYTNKTPGEILESDSFISTDIQMIIDKVKHVNLGCPTGSQCKVWEISIMKDAQLSRSEGYENVYHGGPIQLVREIEHD